jgi:hypothetical protein
MSARSTIDASSTSTTSARSVLAVVPEARAASIEPSARWIVPTLPRGSPRIARCGIASLARGSPR